jgi:hypothetical protein
MCLWTLRHIRIAVLGFVTHSIVQTPLQSESYVYISRLVKTRDPYPGLLQFAILSPSSFPVCLFFSSLSSSFSLISIVSSSTKWRCCHALFTLRGPSVSQPSVREAQSRVASHSRTSKSDKRLANRYKWDKYLCAPRASWPSRQARLDPSRTFPTPSQNPPRTFQTPHGRPSA